MLALRTGNGVRSYLIRGVGGVIAAICLVGCSQEGREKVACELRCVGYDVKTSRYKYEFRFATRASVCIALTSFSDGVKQGSAMSTTGTFDHTKVFTVFLPTSDARFATNILIGGTGKVEFTYYQDARSSAQATCVITKR
jgi:hypothetical protein